ncbi:hypothetical protein ACP70R_049969 [Stipagrostis hirtigluma subsp. patula]
MASPSTWATRLRYALSKMSYSAAVSLRMYNAGKIRKIGEFASCLHSNFFHAKLTSVHWAPNLGNEMAPAIHSNGAAVLVRKLLRETNPMPLFVGDVVVVRDPEDSQFLIRRLAAIEGCEMVSTDENDTPFVLAHNNCWVLADNQSLMPKLGQPFVWTSSS